VHTSVVSVSGVVDGRVGRPTGMPPSTSAVVTAQLWGSRPTTTITERTGDGVSSVALFMSVCNAMTHMRM